MAKFYRTEDRTVLLELFGAGSSVENLKNLKANTTDAAVEKHVPVVTQEGNKITVAVSSVEHPMLPEHYIMGVYIETKNGGQLHKFQPGDTPKATFTLADGDEFVAAYEYCNLHGLWKDKQEFAGVRLLACGNYYFTDKFLLYYILSLDLSMISYYNTVSTKSYFFYERNFL